MQKVYRHRPTGDLYVVEHGVFGAQVGLSGQRFLTLAPVMRLFYRETGAVADVALSEEAYAVLSDSYALELVVTPAEFAIDFEEVPELGARQNSDIQALLAQYADEGCNHANLQWVAMAGLRYAQSMGDSQVRCLLHTLAEHVQKTCPLDPGSSANG